MIPESQIVQSGISRRLSWLLIYYDTNIFRDYFDSGFSAGCGICPSTPLSRRDWFYWDSLPVRILPADASHGHKGAIMVGIRRFLDPVDRILSEQTPGTSDIGSHGYCSLHIRHMEDQDTCPGPGIRIGGRAPGNFVYQPVSLPCPSHPL